MNLKTYFKSEPIFYLMLRVNQGVYRMGSGEQNYINHCQLYPENLNKLKQHEIEFKWHNQKLGVIIEKLILSL